jgi:hypothetical protein
MIENEWCFRARRTKKMENYTESRRGNIRLTFTGRDGTTETCEMQSRPGIDCGLATAGFLTAKGWTFGSITIEPGAWTAGHEWIANHMKHVRSHLMQRPTECIERGSMHRFPQPFVLEVTASRSG